MRSGDWDFSIDGVELVANLIEEMGAARGRNSLAEAMSEATESFCRDVLLPEVRSEMPRDTGFLDSQIAVSEAEGLSRGSVGHAVGFDGDAFQGDTFYAAFLELGWQIGKRTRAGRTHRPGDAYLRRTLYDNERRFRAHVAQHLSRWIRRTRPVSRRAL